jgi:hypothetical protein
MCGPDCYYGSGCKHIRSADNAELQWRFANQDKTYEGSINELIEEM